MELQQLFLQGHKPAEDLEPGDVTDGIVGRTVVASKTLRPRPDMAPLVMLTCTDGQWLRYEPGFPVAVYGPERVIDSWPGKSAGAPRPAA